MTSSQSRKIPTTEEAILTHVEVAQILVGNRRAALDFTVDQVRELAAAILVLDHQLADTNRRMACMMVADTDPPPTVSQPTPRPKREPEITRVPVPVLVGDDKGLTGALEALVKARQRLERDRFSAGENLARQNFEKAAIAVTDHCNPKQRT